MSRTKKHIDEVFRDGLKNLSLLVSNKDLEAIDDKTSVYKDKEPELGDGPFDNFEIRVDESDWLKTKSKLEVEKSAMSQDNFMSRGFEDFELQVTDADWQATYRKLQDKKRRRVAYWWWLSAGVVVLSLGAFLYLHDWSKKDSIAQVNTTNIAESYKNNTNKESVQSPTDPAASHALGNTPSVDPTSSASTDPVTIPGTTATPTQKSVKSASTNHHSSSEAASHATAPQVSEKAATPSENIAGTKVDPATGNVDPKGTAIANSPVEVAAGEIPSGSNKANDESSKVAKTDEAIATQEPKTGDETIVKTEKKAGTPASTDTTEKNTKKAVAKPKNFALEPNRFHYYAGLVNQVGITYRHLDKSNYPMYNKIRNDAEHPFMQWTTGFEIGVQRNHLRFSTGAQVTTQTWSSNYNYSYRIHDSIPVWDTSHTIIKGYLLTRHRDTAMHEEQVVKIQKIQVPFEFSGLWTLNPRLNLVAGCGGLIGFTTRQTGTKILNPVNNQLYYYSRLQDQENDFAFSMTGNAGLQYALKPKFLIMGSLYGNYSTTSRFKSSFQAKDFPYSVGLSLKLLYLIR